MRLWRDLENTHKKSIEYGKKAVEYESKCENIEDDIRTYVKKELSTITGENCNKTIWSLEEYITRVNMSISDDVIRVEFINSFYMEYWVMKKISELFPEFMLSIHSVEGHLMLVMKSR